VAVLKDVKKIECMNLAAEMKQAVIANDHKEVCVVAQKTFEAGYELEDLKLLPTLFNIVASTLVRSGWTPQLPEEP
jgi:hypothetical protein